MSARDRCRTIATAIEQLDGTELEELFKILHQSDCPYTSNNNGVFINLSWLKPALIEQIEEYIEFCNKSRCEVQRYESICELLAQPAASKTQDKDDRVSTVKGFSKSAYTEDKRPSKVSSSMRFYLLKKKYAKLTPPPVVQTRAELEMDDVLIHI